MIQVRAHHLLCIPRFYKGGYDQKFAQNMKNICLSVRKHPSTKIEVIAGEPDVLCIQCPHRDGVKCVQSKRIGKWVVEQDKKVLGYLGLENGSIHKAKDVFELSVQKVDKDTIREVCKGCIFVNNCIKVGINNSFMKDLRRIPRKISRPSYT